ncbi:MAG: hypothetical protein CO001_02980 [Candidatus Portnoybacteria bacterium CG_4_8_14_3_um_filter_40_10]|uniref:Carboxypeptidase regulatory-like domain-containing protein n=1 Tax=Candidatus Portnoybacteria bacterium CG_4_8_14_3_um_filter_40_10 TaxID=1974801 RepID=A0A2M7II32_9BACT|nr:MAG: hypothetical protein CO001_02980 [Candidatus Portnoybacteria bacterium CG_4_8_14_3_um_filter_40_10]
MFAINKKIIIFLAVGFLAVGLGIWYWVAGSVRDFEWEPKGVLEIKVTIGPFCPVEHPGVPCPGPPDAYTSRQVTIFESDGKTIVFQDYLDKEGNFGVGLSPGDYQVLVSPGGIGQPPKRTVTIKNGETTKLDIDIDTGKR